jgi:hypothetical protein
VRVQNACNRLYVCAFDRIRVECVCVKWALRSNVQGTFDCMRAGACV